MSIKADVINEYVRALHLDKKDVVFVDVKSIHFQPAIAQVYACINVQVVLSST